MKTIDLGHKSPDGKEYFDVVVDRHNKTASMYKNTSCQAVLVKHLTQEYGIGYWDAVNRFAILFNLNSPEPIKERIPKKYQKIIFS